MLYNWYAAVATSSTNGSAEGGQGACPTGWHVPTGNAAETDFDILYNTINNDTKYRCNSTNGAIGKAMSAPSGWKNSAVDCQVGNNQQTNNSTGFNGLPAGYRNTSGAFDSMGSITFFWSSSLSSSNDRNRYLYYNITSFLPNSYSLVYGFSVRCLKN